jgi:hypothetical protein
MSTEARVEHLSIAGSPDAWRTIGLSVADSGEIPFMFTSLVVRPADGEDALAQSGLYGWELSGIDPSVTDIDGLSTVVIDPAPPVVPEHPNGAIELDHVVVLTSSLDRTCGTIEAVTGAPLKRVREVGPMRQGFHRIGRGGLIVEVVERPEVSGDQAAFWGLVVNVRDLDAAIELIGPDHIGAPKDAVQPGRRIATVRNSVGLGTAIALMSA